MMNLKRIGIESRFGASVGLALCTFVYLGLAGCGTNDRHPSAEEGKAADAQRLDYIDKLNIPADQKARMKAQMGGPPVQSPAEAAKAKAGQEDKDRGKTAAPAGK